MIPSVLYVTLTSRNTNAIGKWIVSWRGDYSPASKNKYNHAKYQLVKEKLSDGRNFEELDKKDQALMVKTSP